MQEVEDNNDTARLRRTRLLRNIHKMRIERTILLDSLQKRMRKNGTGGALGQAYDEESEDSTESPPTVRDLDDLRPRDSNSLKPQERPLRTKKSHRRLPDLSSPSMPPALPTASTQPPHSALPTPLTGTGLAPNGTMATPEYTLLPPAHLTHPDTHANDPNPPLPPHELFKQHMLVYYLPQYANHFGQMTAQAKAQHAEQTWESLSSTERAAWDHVYEILIDRFRRTADAREWRRVAGNRASRSSAAREQGPDDDVVMLGVEGEEDGH